MSNDGRDVETMSVSSSFDSGTWQSGRLALATVYNMSI